MNSLKRSGAWPNLGDEELEVFRELDRVPRFKGGHLIQRDRASGSGELDFDSVDLVG